MGVPEVSVVMGERMAALNPCRDVWDYKCPTFDWEEESGGRLQLAVAVLFQSTGYNAIATHYHERFSSEFLSAMIGHDEWAFSSQDVTDWLLSEIALSCDLSFDLDFSPRMEREGGQ